MAINQPGVAITIKAFLPTGKTLDEQFIALSIVKDAKDSGNYDLLLAAAHDVSIKTEAKTRRVEDVEPAQLFTGHDEIGMYVRPEATSTVAIVEEDANFSWGDEA
ncbi:hypothetical protein [Caudoviricetes sp.]|nr:hypothetical protein [Caudoviricetes sp.]